MKGVRIAGIAPQDLAVQVFGLGQMSGLMLLHGAGQLRPHHRGSCEPLHFGFHSALRAVHGSMSPVCMVLQSCHDDDATGCFASSAV